MGQPATRLIEVDPLAERERWLELRRQGIGSSDAAACLGVSPWATPHLLYVNKVVGIEQPDTPEMEWGRRQEAIIAEKAAEVIGASLVRPNGIYQHAERDWQQATLDFRVAGEGPVVPVEIKKAEMAAGWGRAMTDEVPLHYKAQTVHQAVVTGAGHAWLAVLIGGSDFRIYKIPVEPEFAATLTEAEAEMWQRIVDRDPPPPDYTHPRTTAWLSQVQPDEGLEPLVGSLGELAAFERYIDLGAKIAKLEKERDAEKGKLLDAMGDRPGITFEGHDKMLRRKVVHRAGYEVKPGSFVELRVVNNKR